MAPDNNTSNQEKQGQEEVVSEDDRAASSGDESENVQEPNNDSNITLTEWTSRFTKYITTLEDRIKELESKANIGGERPSRKQRRNRGSAETVQFFLASDEPRLERWATTDSRWKAKGTFMSEVDDNPLIRVLYRRTSTDLDDSHELEQQSPSPDDIDILEIRIYSKPIAEFVDEKFEFQFSKHGLLHFTKPFRTLITVFPFMKDRLEKLEIIHRPLDATTSSPTIPSHPVHEPGTKSQSSTSSLASPTRLRATLSSGLESKASYHDFLTLSSFMKKYFSTALALYDGYAHARRTKVSFENLWMLFDVGGIVYSASKKEGYKLHHSTDATATDYITTRGFLPQAYKVIGTLGGIPLKKSISENSDFADIQISNGPQKGAVGSNRDKISPFHVYCHCLDFNGLQIQFIRDGFRFPAFDGEKDVTSLQAYPMRYHSKSTQVLGDLDIRGNAFIDLMVVRHKRYNGLTAAERKEEVTGDVIIDMGTHMGGPPGYSQAADPVEETWYTKLATEALEVPQRTCNHTNCHEHSCVKDVYVEHQKRIFNDTWRDLDAKLEENDLVRISTEEHVNRCRMMMEKENLLALFPGIVWGYSLRSRKWVRLDISKLQDVTYQDGWNDLVLPKGHKKMVQAMVQTFATDSRLKTAQRYTETPSEVADRFGFDLVKKKGQGCIILLHGAPGVGKTSTAECVAAHTQRPLFPMTSGDIGFSPEDIEDRLQKNFELAHKWGCVLLLDEADVFLTKRNKEDIKRNGLVSVFLRVLEYYSGILILTTNRVGAFDEAFHSRIHLSLFYPSLDLKKSLKILETNFRRIDKHNEDREKKQDAPMKIEDKKIRQYWKKNHEVLKWNGRQIRNAFQTAMALADCEARENGTSPVITVKHFETIANASVDFAKYMARVQGNEADRIAEIDRTRLGHNPEIQRGLKRVESDSESSESDSSGSKGVSSDSSDEEEKIRKKSKKKAKEREAKKSKSKKEEKGKKKSSSSKGKSRESEDSESEEG